VRSLITRVHAREILDSRGRPTVEVEVELASGDLGVASVPAGASRGHYEAVELRDGDHSRHAGFGVTRAVENVNTVIGPVLIGLDALMQEALDAALNELDGTDDKSRLGANALLAVSLGTARAAARLERLPLWRYLGGAEARVLPLPLINLLSGGLHASRSLDFQDFQLVPIGASSYKQALDSGAGVRLAMLELLSERGLSTLKADEGGFAPQLGANVEAVELTVEAIERAGLMPGSDVAIAVDLAASHLFDRRRGLYYLAKEGLTVEADGVIDLLERWCAEYPIVSLEDPLAEDDWEGWRALTVRLGRHVQIIGDDLFVTNLLRLGQGIANDVANAILVKPNQVGTLTETLAVVEEARRAGYATIVSARSGETEDTFLADLAVATNAGQIKIGSLAQSERLAKYNQLLRIEEQLGAEAVFAGASALAVGASRSVEEER
jgi:enolase